MAKVKVIGHRGFAAKYPENSLIGFEKALQLQIDGIELDVHLSKDGEVIVMHDETIERTTNGSGLIKDMTVQQLKQVRLLDVKGRRTTDEQIPLLKEVLQLATNYPNVIVNIELKTSKVSYNAIEENVLKVVDKYGTRLNIVYSSFHLPTLVRLKKLHPQAKIALLINKPLPKLNEYVKTFQLESIHLSRKIYNKVRKEWQKAENMRIWTVNKPVMMKRYLGENIDAIITDHPDKALKIRNKMCRRIK